MWYMCGMSRVQGFLSGLSVAGRFKVISLVILVAGLIGIGSWMQRQIGEGIVHGTGHTTALYVGSLIAPALQGLTAGSPLSSERMATLDSYFQAPALREQIPSFKIWGPDGVVLYATDPGVIGRRYPVEDRLARAWRGETTAGISNLEAAENAAERPLAKNLLETYSPVYVGDATHVVAVAEFYQRVDELRQEIAVAQAWSWVLVAGAMLAIYLLLGGIVQRASDTILEQQVRLSDQVVRLQELLAQNQDLTERERRASERVVTISERFLRRISAELHDGPAQDLSLALLWFDAGDSASAAGASAAAPAGSGLPAPQVRADALIRQALERALNEVRDISSGLGIPELYHLALSSAIERAVFAHEQRTGTSVRFCRGELPAEVADSTKLTSYRLIQESLANSFRHGGGRGQALDARVDGGVLILTLSDEGPGFDLTQVIDSTKHLGIAGMRERLQAEGGSFHIESAPGRGTQIVARLPLRTEAEVQSE